MNTITPGMTNNWTINAALGGWTGGRASSGESGWLEGLVNSGMKWKTFNVAVDKLSVGGCLKASTREAEARGGRQAEFLLFCVDKDFGPLLSTELPSETFGSGGSNRNATA